jgi:hypothetical protein
MGGQASARRPAAYAPSTVKGVRYALRNFTAVAVKEHLRSQLVRLTAVRSEQLTELAARSTRK